MFDNPRNEKDTGNLSVCLPRLDDAGVNQLHNVGAYSWVLHVVL